MKTVSTAIAFAAVLALSTAAFAAHMGPGKGSVKFPSYPAPAPAVHAYYHVAGSVTATPAPTTLGPGLGSVKAPGW